MINLLKVSYEDLLNNVTLEIPDQSKCFITGIDKDTLNTFIDVLSRKIVPTNGTITFESDDIVTIGTQIETSWVSFHLQDNPLVDILNIKSLNTKKDKEYLIYLYNALCKQPKLLIINDAFKDLDTITRLRLLKYLKTLPITVIYASSRYIADVCYEEWSSMIVLVSSTKVCDYHPLSLKARHKDIYKSLLYKLSMLTIYEQQ